MFVSMSSILFHCAFLSIASANQQQRSTKITTRAATDTLQFVHAIWRHGDRTALTVCPSDPNFGAEKWPQGYGELTELGLHQSFTEGETTRTRYDGFISKNYSSYEVYIRSTDYNRTLQSAYAFLSGLYSEEQERRVEKDLPLKPVPVHTVPQAQDSMLRTDAYCRAANIENDKVQNSAEVLSLMEQHKDFLSYVSQMSGCAIKRFESIYELQDPLMCEYYHSDTNPWPAWVNGSLYLNITNLFNKASQFWFSTTMLKRLRAGQLLHDILRRNQMVVENKLDKRLKFYGYSAHDTTITALLSALGAYSGKVPPYGTIVFVELHKINQSYEVQIHYKETVQAVNSVPTFTAKQLQIAGCALSCPLEQLRQLAAPFAISDWTAECNNDSNASWRWLPQTDLEIIMCVVCAGLLAAIILLIGILVCRVRDKSVAAEAKQNGIPGIEGKI